jgi:hypothetical protein
MLAHRTLEGSELQRIVIDDQDPQRTDGRRRSRYLIDGYDSHEAALI